MLKAVLQAKGALTTAEWGRTPAGHGPLQPAKWRFNAKRNSGGTMGFSQLIPYVVCYGMSFLFYKKEEIL